MSTIPKEKDPIVTELERICTNELTIPVTFIEANLREANFGLDQLDDIKFPVLIYVTTSRNRSRKLETDVIVRTAQVTALLLDERKDPDQSTSDYSSADVNAGINKMRQLGENLWYWINRSPISVNGGVDEWSSDAVYQRFDRDLVGQAIQFDWTVDTGKTGHYNVAP